MYSVYIKLITQCHELSNLIVKNKIKLSKGKKSNITCKSFSLYNRSMGRQDICNLTHIHGNNWQAVFKENLNSHTNTCKHLPLEHTNLQKHTHLSLWSFCCVLHFFPFSSTCSVPFHHHLVILLQFIRCKCLIPLKIDPH